ncbi:MAG: hypothetical protein AB7I27_07480 [Bacteriovoracaceae bacterium]
MKWQFLWLSLVFVIPAFGQNLMEERIWKVAPRKKSIFLDSGVFHNSSELKNSSVTGVRSSSVPGRGYERVVIDFNTESVPKLYGHISAKDKKLSVDFFDTNVQGQMSQLASSKNVKGIDFISVDGKSITFEMNMNGKSSFDIFYLENPGRLVIDIR